MQLENERLLVVDDDPLSLDVLARRLERQGYAVTRAACGKEALEHIDRAQVDLVLLDHHMPGMTGLDVLVELRRSRTPAELPVIMVTAVSEASAIVDALNRGANDYLTKPLELDVALARVRAQLSRSFAERKQHSDDEHDASAARGSNDGLWDWNLETNEFYYSARWKEMLGYQEHEFDNSPAEWFSRIHPDDSNRVQRDLEAAIGGSGTAFESEHRLQHRDGSWRWVRSRGRATLDENRKPLRLAGSQTDVTETKSADPLTNLPNRAMFQECVASAIARSGRDRDYSFAVLLLDIDRFKVINDSLGHLVGDELLVGVARRLRSIDQHFNATLARMGGDEFAVLAEEITGPPEAKRVAAWVQHSLALPFSLEGRDVFCSMSIGIVPGPGDAARVDDILRDADTAMYRAKALGGGRFEVFENDMRRQAIARLEMESDMRLALDQGDFEVFYQPKVDLNTSAIVGFEALVRWKHRTRGLIMPNEFIPLAEETGLIVRLGMTVLQQACQQLAVWQRRFERTSPLTMAVNVSCRQFRDPHFCENVERVLLASGIVPRTLRLEVTESLLMEDSAETARILARLKDIGVGLKIDDFGTGFSSLSYLCRLPFDTLKIDRSFVSDMGLGEDGSEIVKSIIALAAGLKMSVVAEGVETREQMEQLRSLGCQSAQGFYFSRAVAPQDAELLLAGGNDSGTMDVHREPEPAYPVHS